MRKFLLGGGMYARAFPTGTLMVFQQTAAPPGWTKQATHDDKCLRVVSGSASSGGATAFTSVFGAGKSTSSYTLTTPDIPSHSHVEQYFAATAGGSNTFTATATNTATETSGGLSTQTTGGGGGHSHTLSLDLHYVDIIIASKT